MIVPALSNWIFLAYGCEQRKITGEWDKNLPWKDPGEYRGTTEGHFAVARPCCYESPRPLDTAVRNGLHRIWTTHSMRAHSLGCAHPVALFCSDG